MVEVYERSEISIEMEVGPAAGRIEMRRPRTAAAHPCTGLRTPTGEQIFRSGGASVIGGDFGTLQTDWLVSYEPTPGTVACFGYGATRDGFHDDGTSTSSLSEPVRRGVGFFVSVAVSVAAVMRAVVHERHGAVRSTRRVANCAAPRVLPITVTESNLRSQTPRCSAMRRLPRCQKERIERWSRSSCGRQAFTR